MALETSSTTDPRDEPVAPTAAVVPMSDENRGPFTLASLLELNADELAQPLSRGAPPEHRWEQLSLAITPENGAAPSAEMRRGAATQPPASEQDLIPGLDVPGAVEVPVYLAGRTLHDLMAHDGVISAAQPPDVPQQAPPAVTPRAAQNPAINAPFGQTGDTPVLWPRRRQRTAPRVLAEECAKCGAPSHGDRCAACGHGTSVPVHTEDAGAWHRFVAAFVGSDSRLVRTVGALMMVPGELTSAWTAGRRRRYLGPVALAVSSVVLFAMITALGGLRPRPDRTLMIGAERTAENPGGLADRTPLNLAVDAPPDLVHDVANAIDFVPVLWLPLMACGVVAIVALARTKRQHDDYMELVFATDFAAWYVLWWGVAVPLILLLSKFGFEYSAAFDGLNHVRYVADGRIDGLSATWNTLRNLTVSPLFHSVLVAAGIGPWAVLAFRRAFDSSWLRAGCAGLLIATVPLLLLIPFA